MPACSQIVLDRWLVIFIWMFLFLVFVSECFSFCFFSCVYVFAFLPWVFVLVESECLVADNFGQTVFLDFFLSNNIFVYETTRINKTY